MVEVFGDMTHWKRMWQLTAGFNNESTTDFVSKKLLAVEKQLEYGLLYYKPRSQKSLEKLKNEKIKKDLKLKNLVERLEKFVGIDALQLWDILCYYLVTEFQGSAMALVNFTLSDMKIIQLIIDIWGFYTSERMFMLKLLGVIIEYHNEELHPYCDEYKQLIDKITLDKLKCSLINQFKSLVREAPPNIKENSDICTPYIQNLWAERNMREQIQVLNLLILIVRESHITSTQLEELLNLFKEHNFGKQPSYENLLSEKHIELVRKISYLEVVLFLTSMDMSMFQKIDMNKWLGKLHKSIDSIIISLHYSPEHSPLLLNWMLFNYQYEGEEAYHARYSQFGNKALQLNVFGFLRDLITHPSFKDRSKLSVIAHKVVYSLLSDLCSKFDNGGSVSNYGNVFELCSELLSMKSIARDFCEDLKSETGLYSVWNSALELFPYEFEPLSSMANGLARCGGKFHEFVMNKLQSLTIFTELYDPYKVRVIPVEQGSEECVVQNPHQPLPSVDFTIPAQSTAVVRDWKNNTLVHYGVCVNYWTVLHAEIIRLIEGSLDCEKDHMQLKILRVQSGLKLIATCVKYIKHPYDIPEKLIFPTEMVFDIILKFINTVDPPAELLTYSLDVFVNLTPLFGQEVQKRLCGINLLPSLNNTELTYKEYARGESFQSNGIGYFLINTARSSGKYQLILSYFNLLTAFFNLDVNNVMEIELPGLIFILREIFPHITTWHFKNEMERQQILYHCTQYFLNILQLSQEQIKEYKEKDILHKTCLLSLLNIENGIALLKLIAVGNPYLQAVMEEQTNWVAGAGLQRIRLVQLSIATLMQILRLKPLVLEKNTLAPLEYVIYTQPKQKDALRIIPIVTGYMNHVFSKHLPSLACRLLKRFALEIQMSLMACLDMESDQIRQLFLQRLRDESESEELKTAILELVAACVERQPGLTEAFFKVYHAQDKTKVFYRPQGHDIADGILSYMAEYLSVVQKDPVRLSSPLLCCIMNLFHALWKNHMEMLVADFRKDPKFWKYFTSPLFHKIHPDIKAYSQILNIIGIEIYQSHGAVDENLKNSLQTFFDPKTNYLNGLLDHIFALPFEEPVIVIDETPEWLSLLTSWKDFMTISIRLLPFDLTETLKQSCFDRCLVTLIAQVQAMKDPRTIILLSELCMIMLSRWKSSCVHKKQLPKLAQQTTALARHIHISYDCLHNRAKEALLATIIYLMQSLNQLFENDETILIELLEPICAIMSLEISLAEMDCNEKYVEKKQSNDKKIGTADISKIVAFSRNQPKVDHNVISCVLSFTAFNQILLSQKSGLNEWVNTFGAASLTNNILCCLSLITPHQSKRKITLAMLDTLTHLARGTFAKLILDSDIGQYLWLALLPPKNMKESVMDNLAESWKATDWWQIYHNGIDFIRIALEQNSKAFSGEAIAFMGVHEEYIIDAILLPRHSLEPESIQLTISCLELVDELLKHEEQWKKEHESSLLSIMKAIQLIADYSISLIHRPRMLRCHIDGVTPDVTSRASSRLTCKPSEKVIFIVNKLLDIIGLSTRCLSAFGPDILTLLTEDDAMLTKWKPIVEMQFGAPKLNSLSLNITFGSLMSAVCLLTRALTYTYKAKGKILNRLSGSLQNSRLQEYLMRLSRTDAEGDLFSTRRTVQTINPSSQIGNFGTGASAMLLSTDWLMKFDTKHTLFALEHLLTFLASQALFMTRSSAIPSRDQQLIRRELSSELYSYHEFVRKKVLLSARHILCRPKLGTCVLKSKGQEDDSYDESSIDEEDSDVSPSEAQSTTRKSTESSMRVDVVRKQHLEASRTSATRVRTSSVNTPTRFQPDIVDVNKVNRPPTQSVEALLQGLQGVRSVSESYDISPIKNVSRERPSLDLTNIPKHVIWNEDSAYPGSPMSVSPRDEAPVFSPIIDISPIPSTIKPARQAGDSVVSLLPPEKDSDKYYPLTEVLMFEEDYLHFLSYLFMYICPMDNY